MLHVDCENCFDHIDRDNPEDFVARDFEDPDFVRFTVTCDRCGWETVIGQIHIDDYDFGGVDHEFPYPSMRVCQGWPGMNNRSYFSLLSP